MMKTDLPFLPALLLLFFVFKNATLHAQPAQKEYEEAKDAYYDGNYKKAEKLFHKTLTIREKELGREHPETLEAIHRLGRTYGKLRENEKALAYFQEALAITLKLHGPESEDAAGCYQDIGNIHNQLYEPDKANEAYGRALSIFEKLHGRESSEVGNVLMVTGTSYHKMAAYRDAEKYYLQALGVFKKSSLPESEDFNRIYSNLGYLYRKTGDLEKALDFGLKALEIKLLHYEPMHPSVAKYHRNIGKVYEEMGRFGEALPYMQTAVKILEKTVGAGHPQTAGSYGELAHVHAGLKDYKTALKLYRKSVRLQEKTLPADHPYVVAGFFNIASVNSELGLWDEALDGYRTALERLASRAYRPGNLLAMTRRDMAVVFFEKNELDSALAYCQLGLVEIAQNFTFQAGDFYQNPALEDVQAEVAFLQILAEKARFLEARFKQKNNGTDLSEVLKTTLLAVRLIEKMRRGYQSETSRQFLNSGTSDVYKTGVRVAMQLYQKTENADYLWQAFQLSEKSKANLLWRSLNEGAALQDAGLPPEEKTAIEQLELQISNLEEELTEAEEGADSEAIKSLEDEIFEAKVAHEEQLKTLEKKYPEFYQLRYAPPVVAEEVLRKKLAVGRLAMVEYFYDERQLFIFLLDGNGLQGRSLPLPEGFEKTVKKLRDFQIAELSKAGPESSQTVYLRQLGQLYAALVLPVENDLAGKPKLVIVPHGVLNYLPFEMLVKNAVGDGFAEQRYLLHDFSVQYAWSAAMWAKDFEQKNTSGQVSFSGFAPSYEGSAFAGVVAENFRSSLTGLTFSASEVELASGYFQGEIFLDGSATESAFRQNAPRSRVLHLATHAFAGDEHPLQSGFVFSNEKDTLNDGFLHAYEIYNLRLDAELAVMSACNTGFGQLAEGEGVISLGRAFFYAGCRSVVMSQWLANDQSTSKLMGSFYRHLSDGKPKDEALRQAKLDYLATADKLTSHPYFWAGMVAVGDMRPVRQGSFLKNWWWVLAGSGIVFLALWGMGVKNRKTRI